MWLSRPLSLVMYASALRSNSAVCLGAALASASRIASTAASALRGSCHQCRSKREASGPDDWPGSFSGARPPEAPAGGLPPAWETALPHPVVESVPVLED